MPQVDVQTEIIIQQPAAAVAAFASDPDNVTAWYKNIKSVEWKSPRPVTEGSLLAFVAHFLGRRLAYAYEVIELDLPRRMVMRTADGPFPMETTYTWTEEGPGKTRMRLRNRGEAKGFAAITAPLMSRMMRKANLDDLALLKRLLESAALTDHPG